MLKSNIRLLLALLLFVSLATYARKSSDRTKDKRGGKTVERATVDGGGASDRVKTRRKMDIDIRKLKINVEKTPSAKDSRKGSRGAGDEWICVEAEVEMSGQGWLDEFEARWSVIVDADSGKKPYLLKGSTTFVNLRKGKNYITVFVSPSFFKRYVRGERVRSSKVSARLEIAVNGKVEAKKSEGRDTKLFSNPKKCREERQGLLPRSKTPFASLDYDYYVSEKDE